MKKWKKKLLLLLAATMVIGTVEAPLEIQATEYWPSEIEIESDAAVVMEASTGTILYEKNMDDVHYPASITKIMTTLLCLENGNLDDTATYSKEAVYDTEGSNIARDVGEEMTLEQVLYAVMLESCNRSAYAAAEHVGGTVADFVDMMNEKATELGCTNTHFANPHGLHDDNHYTTAHDMALIAREAWNSSETYRIMTGTKRYIIPPTNKHKDTETILQNHNEMLNAYKSTKYLYEYCVGGKTGYTEKANSTLVTYAQKDGMTLICVIMNAVSPAQWYDSINLYDYCFDNFKLVNVADNENRYDTENLHFGTLNTNESFAELDADGNVVLPVAADFSDTTPELIEVTDEEDVIGKLSYTYAGRTVGEVNIKKTNASITEFQFANVITDEKTEEKTQQKVFQVTPKKVAVVILIVAAVILLIVLLIKFAANFYVLRQKFYRWKNSRSPYKRIKRRKLPGRRRRRGRRR